MLTSRQYDFFMTTITFAEAARQLKEMGISLTWRHKDQVYCVRKQGERNGFENKSLVEAWNEGVRIALKMEGR
jgi:hypothetical protein